jgi:K+-transporting ATPase KdpF subunit
VSGMETIGLVVAIGLLVYLFITLVFPERF